METIERDGLAVRVYRYGFSPGFYAEARRDGVRVAFTGVYKGRGSKRRAIDAAIHEAIAGQVSPDDLGCPG